MKLPWLLSGVVVCLCVRTPFPLRCVCVCLFLKKNKKVYVSILLDKYTYKIIILYIAKLNLIFTIFFTNLLLCLSLAHLLVESKLEFELNLFTKQTNI